MIDEKTGHQCCFCGESIVSSNVNPCDINILTNWNKSVKKQNNQTFWCHLDCFREKLHPSVKQYLVVDLLGNEE